MSTIQVHISPAQASGFLQVTLTIPTAGLNDLRLEAAAWRHGRYQVQNFAARIRGLAAFAGDKKLRTRKETKDIWHIELQENEQITVSYEYNGNDLNAGSCYADGQLWLLNFPPLVLRVQGQEKAPIAIRLALPENFDVATSLPKGEKHGELSAKNWHELIDSPVLAGAALNYASYRVEGCDTQFHFWSTANYAPSEKVLQEFKAFTEVQIKLFREFPANEYHFLNVITPYFFYHGVEHLKSTVIVLGPDYQMQSKAHWGHLMGVSSHELFHAWNALSMRPAEITPDEFGQERYFRTGYVIEGVTTYYGDLMLARSGVFDAPRYYEELDTLLVRHLTNAGRHRNSVGDSSVELWLDGYENITPGRKTSIYVKGALVAFLLDVKIRKKFKSEKSMDDVIRLLYETYGKGKTAFEEKEYWAVCEEVLGEPVADFFARFTDGTEDLQPHLWEALTFLGLQAERVPDTQPLAERFGLKVGAEGKMLKVLAVDEASAAHALLQKDDEIIALGGYQVAGMNAVQALAQQAEKLEIHFFRKQRLHAVTLPASSGYFGRFRVQENPSASAEAIAQRKHWLGC